MSKQRAGEELETAFRQVLDEFFYGIRPTQPNGLLTTQHHTEPPAGRHNYQRDMAKANPTLYIYYKSMHLASVKRKPHSITINPKKPDKAPKGYFATKVLERMLFYEYPDVRAK